MKVKMYSMDGCGFCEASKRWFQLNNIEVMEIKINDREKRQEFYIETTLETGKDIRSMPQIWINEEHVGGYNELMANPPITKVTSFNEDF